eukprot:7749600-Pyramimonas_sp.AAC.1
MIARRLGQKCRSLAQVHLDDVHMYATNSPYTLFLAAFFDSLPSLPRIFYRFLRPLPTLPPILPPTFLPPTLPPISPQIYFRFRLCLNLLSLSTLFPTPA